ncbi:hypothetical protein HK24_01775 [Gluconobacter sp. DsW_058]|nr:hypothetical protein HK24_01775 [Gluconobacter sp. DsW_058]
MTILVRQLSGFVLPVFRNTSFPEVGFLSVRIALLRSRYKRGIQDLARHRQISGVPQGRIKAIEQTLDRSHLEGSKNPLVLGRPL